MRDLLHPKKKKRKQTKKTIPKYFYKNERMETFRQIKSCSEIEDQQSNQNKLPNF